MKKYVIPSIVILFAATSVYLLGGISIGVDPDETIHGIDKNNNGIRDEIDWYIRDETAISSSRKAALKQLAKAIQRPLSEQVVSASHAESIHTEYLTAFSCYGLHFQGVGMLNHIKALTLNTAARRSTYKHYESLTPESKTYELPEHPCEK